MSELAPASTSGCLIRLRLPNRPGSLARITSELGMCGVDIQRIEVVGADGGHAIDDLLIVGGELERALERLAPEVTLLGRLDDVELPDAACTMAQLCARIGLATTPEERDRELLEAARTLAHADEGILLHATAELALPVVSTLGSLPAIAAPEPFVGFEAFARQTPLVATGNDEWAPPAYQEASEAAHVLVAATQPSGRVIVLLRRSDFAFAAAELWRVQTLLETVGCPPAGVRFRPAEPKVQLPLARDLRAAVEQDQLVLHYQPIVSLEAGHVVGVEALVRWQHPTRGLIPPLDFIGLAEQTGQIKELGAWVLDTALRQADEWQSRYGESAPFVTVNLSSRQLEDDDIVDTLAGVLAATDVDPAKIVLELTETVLLRDVERMIDRLHALRALGPQIAIDDFGTGYSSLQYLRRFPADIIKVAKPFVDGVVLRASDEYRIAFAIVRLGESFGMTTLAEGIELAEQRDRLSELGYTLGQGYLFARPLPEPELSERLARELQGAAGAA